MDLGGQKSGETQREVGEGKIIFRICYMKKSISNKDRDPHWSTRLS